MAKVESDYVIPREAEIKLREKIIGFRVLDECEAVAAELIARVDDDEIVGLKLAANIVDADRDELLGLGQFIQRLPTTTHDHRRTGVYVVKVSQSFH